MDKPRTGTSLTVTFRHLPCLDENIKFCLTNLMDTKIKIYAKSLSRTATEAIKAARSLRKTSYHDIKAYEKEVCLLLENGKTSMRDSRNSTASEIKRLGELTDKNFQVICLHMDNYISVLAKCQDELEPENLPRDGQEYWSHGSGRKFLRLKCPVCNNQTFANATWSSEGWIDIKERKLCSGCMLRYYDDRLSA